MPNTAYLKFNDLAPDVELLDTSGKTMRLSALWQGKVLVLAFTRHFGCPQCKEMMEQLVEFKPELAAKGFALAVVTQATPERASAFCA